MTATIHLPFPGPALQPLRAPARPSGAAMHRTAKFTAKQQCSEESSNLANEQANCNRVRIAWVAFSGPPGRTESRQQHPQSEYAPWGLPSRARADCPRFGLRVHAKR